MPAKTKDDFLCKIKLLRNEGLTNKEIAAKLGVTVFTISNLSYREFGPNQNYLKRITKHKHLHEEVLEYFLTHDMLSTSKRFKLTLSELKSCLSVAYAKADLKHLRKDKRRHDKWTPEQLVTMLRYCGILRRRKISQIINRDSERVIKEKLRSLNVASRNINGCNISQFRKMFLTEPRYQIRGEAGPGSTNTNRFVIIPWFHVVELYKKNPEHDQNVLMAFECYERFQQYFWNGHPWEMMKKDKEVVQFLFERDVSK